MAMVIKFFNPILGEVSDVDFVIDILLVSVGVLIEGKCLSRKLWKLWKFPNSPGRPAAGLC